MLKHKKISISYWLLSGPGKKYYTQQWGWRTWRGVERNGGDDQGGGRGGGGGEWTCWQWGVEIAEEKGDTLTSIVSLESPSIIYFKPTIFERKMTTWMYCSVHRF